MKIFIPILLAKPGEFAAGIENQLRKLHDDVCWEIVKDIARQILRERARTKPRRHGPKKMKKAPRTTSAILRRALKFQLKRRTL